MNTKVATELTIKTYLFFSIVWTSATTCLTIKYFFPFLFDTTLEMLLVTASVLTVVIVTINKLIINILRKSINRMLEEPL